MRVWIMLLSLIVLCAMAVNGPAQQCAKKHTLWERFQKMDTNHDGIVTQAEFVAGHPKAGAKAEKFYNDLIALGGTTTKGGATGMTFEQFKKAHKLWREAHPKKQPAGN